MIITQPPDGISLIFLDSRHQQFGKRVFSVELYERNERNSSLYPGGIGIPPRTNSRERGEAVFIDGLISLDGIPVGVERRGSLEKWEGREKIVSRGTQRKIMICSKYRLFSVAYLMVMLFIGVIWQFLPGVI
jgi:hypothetical protein